MIQGRRPIASGTVPALAGPSPLNMSQLGLPTGSTQIRPGVSTFGTLGGYLAANVRPYKINAAGNYVLQAAWSPLNYPSTSTKAANQLEWTQVRRPAYVVVKLTGPSTLCPIGAYHAPSNRAQSSWGAFMAGMARELYVINQVDGADAPTANLVRVTKGVWGGDFNHSVDTADWPGSYNFFVSPLARDDTGGANAVGFPPYNGTDSARRTTVQIVGGPKHNVPITSGNASNYFRYKNDLTFYPTGSGVTGRRVNLLTTVVANAGGVYTIAIQAAGAVMTAAAAAVAAAGATQRMTATGPQLRSGKRNRGVFVYTWSPIICGAWAGTFTNWGVSLGQFTLGNITDARRAGEYIHIFISDHLPLVMTIPF